MGESRRRKAIAKQLSGEFGDRFWAKVSRTDTCWLWTGARDRRGYGLFFVGRKQRFAHRIAYELTQGPISSTTVLMHACDNPPCVRPEHLVPGTLSTNVNDMLDKGRDVGGGWRRTEITIDGPRISEKPGHFLFKVTVVRPNKRGAYAVCDIETTGRTPPSKLIAFQRLVVAALGDHHDSSSPEAASSRFRLWQGVTTILGGYWLDIREMVRSGQNPEPLLRRFVQEGSPYTDRRVR